MSDLGNNKEAMEISGSTPVYFVDVVFTEAQILIRKAKIYFGAAILMYLGLFIFFIIKDIDSIVQHPENLVAWVAGVFAWALLLLIIAVLTATPMLSIGLVFGFIRWRRLVRSIAVHPSLQFSIDEGGLSVTDYSGTSLFLPSSHISRIVVGKRYVVFKTALGFKRVLPMRTFKDSDIRTLKAIAAKIQIAEP